MAELPTGTVTFLFTDLEGSTRLWDEHPEAMKAALAHHDEILRDAVGKHNGHVVKTTGDGVHAAFARAHDAIAAAVDAQHALDIQEWLLPEALRVRMGIHTGETDLRDGDYYGAAVNRAARLAAVAHGRQIVVSLATEQLVRDSSGQRMVLVDLGEHRLRDLERPERVFQVCAVGIEADFPPLRTGDRVLGYLPQYRDDFVGREREVADIADLMYQHRLVTLTGLGGAGKSRLAIESARRVVDAFPDGTWFVGLAALGDGALIPNAIANALRIPEATGRPLVEVVATALEPRRLLLLLDNCEHVVHDAAKVVARLLDACLEVSVITTSREALGVRGEHPVPVLPLGVPDAESEDPEVVMAAESVKLFAVRAREVKPGFTLDVDNAADIARVCRHLDGIPLAIELAAARISVLSPAELDKRLDQRLGILASASRATEERHQTLRAVIDWSYELLEGDGAQLFAHASVFAGGFSLDAAESVVGGDVDVIGGLSGLVSKSLVVSEERGGATRFRMLETLRQYALEKLEGIGQLDDVRHRHAAYYASLVEHLRAQLIGPDEALVLDSFELELPNLRVAMRWTRERAATDLAWRIGASSGQLLYERGLLADLDELIRPLLDESWDVTPEERAQIMGDWIGVVAYAGDLATWRHYTQEAVDQTAAAGAGPYPPAEALLAMVLALVGEHAAAAEHARAAVANLTDRVAVDPVKVMQALSGAAWALHAVGEHAEAIELGKRFLDAARASESPSQISHALWSYGEMIAPRDPERALTLATEAAALAERARLPLSEASALHFGAGYATQITDHRRALEMLQRLLHLNRSIGPGMSCWALRDLALVVFELGALRDAATLLGAADALRARYPWENVYSTGRQQWEDNVRARLDTTDLTDAFQSGSAMDFRTAVAAADDVADRLLAEEPADV